MREGFKFPRALDLHLPHLVSLCVHITDILFSFSLFFETETFSFGLKWEKKPPKKPSEVLSAISLEGNVLVFTSCKCSADSSSLISLSFKCTLSTRFKRTDISAAWPRIKFGMKKSVLSHRSTRLFASPLSIKLSLKLDTPRSVNPPASWPRIDLWPHTWVRPQPRSP